MSASRNYLILFVLLFGIGTAFSVNVNAGIDICGNGIVEDTTDPPEECDNCLDPLCDPFPADEECSNGEDLGRGLCQFTFCGDGIVQATNGEGDNEFCDDGTDNSNTTPDACRTNCAEPNCGDGVVDTNDGCDDGNLNNDDGCSSLCEEEDGWTCTGTAPSICTEIDLCAGFTPEPTTCGAGECAATGETTCDPATGNTGDSCTPGTPSSEVCDGLDNDCDGAIDDDPSCAAATVIIDGCDSGVPDPTGSIAEGILNCNGTTRNHGQFVSCAAQFLNSLGLSSYDKEAIQSCVGKSEIGK